MSQSKNNTTDFFSEEEIRRYYEHYLPLERIRTTGKEWRVPCPIHQGKRDSFSVNRESGVWHCHSKCDRGGNIFQFETEMSGHNGQEARAAVLALMGRTPQAERKIVKTYEYYDETGKLLHQTVRYEPKGFSQRRPDGNGGWVWNLKGVRTVLYNLPAVSRAPVVFVVEGEKDADALIKLGFVATTGPMGAGHWKLEYSRSLKRKEVIVIPDADDAGRDYAKKVIASLKGVALSVQQVTLPGAKDAAEWIEKGGTLDQLSALVEQAGILRDEPPGPAHAPAPKAKPIPKVARKHAAETYRADFPELIPLIEPILYPGLTILGGRPKIGKSWLALQMALALVNKSKLCGYLSVRNPAKVLYVSLEDREPQLKKRLRFLVPEESYLEGLDFIYDLEPLFSGGLEQLDQTLSEDSAQVLVVDSLLAAVQQSDRKNKDIMQADYNIIRNLRELAWKHSVGLSLIAHTRKAPGDFLDMIQGTTGTTAAADAIWVLRKTGEKKCVLEVTGREIPTNTFGMERLQGSPAWIITGEGDEVTQSDSRQAIMQLLRDKCGPTGRKDKKPSPGLKPTEISQASRIPISTVNRILADLLDLGLIIKTMYGHYNLPGQNEPWGGDL